MAYLLDANVFIQAKNLHYGFDLCPGFWEWIESANRSRTVYSIDKVRDELIGGADELSEWASKRGEELFRTFDSSTVPSLYTTSQWAYSQNYTTAAVNTFLQEADYYLIAYAHAHGHVVVTHEVRAETIKKIKIPNACTGVGVRWLTPYQMLRRERAQFILNRQSRLAA